MTGRSRGVRHRTSKLRVRTWESEEALSYVQGTRGDTWEVGHVAASWREVEIRDFDKSVVTLDFSLLQLVLGDKMGASGKSLRQIYAELLGGGDGLERSSFPEIVGASKP